LGSIAFIGTALADEKRAACSLQQKRAKQNSQMKTPSTINTGKETVTKPHPQGIPTTQQKSSKQALEERLKKLEAIVRNLDLVERRSNPDELQSLKASSAFPMSPSQSHASFPIQDTPPRKDLEDLFFSNGSSYLFLTEIEVRKAIQESFFLKYVIYTLSSTIAPPTLVTAEFASRKEMAEFYFKRAESFLRRVFRKPSYHGVLGLFGLVLYCTSMELVDYR
jgi:hypothetical protein